jgi:hypothetical protein
MKTHFLRQSVIALLALVSFLPAAVVAQVPNPPGQQPSFPPPGAPLFPPPVSFPRGDFGSVFPPDALGPVAPGSNPFNLPEPVFNSISLSLLAPVPSALRAGVAVRSAPVLAGKIGLPVALDPAFHERDYQ